MAGKRGRVPARLVEPVSLLDLSLGDVLLGLMETGDAQLLGATAVGAVSRLRPATQGQRMRSVRSARGEA